MTQAIQFHSRVGKDGVLHIQMPLGESEAGADVVVTIQRVDTPPASAADQSDWHAFVASTYGSCAGLGLERPEQGTVEERDPVE